MPVSVAGASAPTVDRHVVARGDVPQDVADLLFDTLGRDAVGLVEGALLVAPPLGLGERGLERAGHVVGVEDHPAVEVARRPADGLDQRGLRAQIALLVGIQDRDQAAFRDVEALAQQVDPDQHVEHAKAQIPNDLNAFQRVDVGVQIAHARCRSRAGTRSGPRPCAW